MKNNLEKKDNIIKDNLFSDIKQIIDDGRNLVAQTINSALSATYWHIGKRINEDILNNERAEYGKQILPTLSAKLIIEYGKGFSARNLKRMVNFYVTFEDYKIVATLWRQLTWSHFILIISIKTDLEREFYAQMCRIERWSVRTLQKKLIPCFLNALL